MQTLYPNSTGGLEPQVTKSTEDTLGTQWERIDAVTAEFSPDKEDSALSRLVERVERAQANQQ